MPKLTPNLAGSPLGENRAGKIKAGASFELISGRSEITTRPREEKDSEDRRKGWGSPCKVGPDGCDPPICLTSYVGARRTGKREEKSLGRLDERMKEALNAAGISLE